MEEGQHTSRVDELPIALSNRDIEIQEVYRHHTVDREVKPPHVAKSLIGPARS
jgi:hypothetical protein